MYIEHKHDRLINRVVEGALAFLVSAEMVVEVGEHLGSTEFGTLVSRLYIDPRSADLVVRTLRDGHEYCDLGLIQLICSTPDMPKLYVRNSDLGALSRMLEDHVEELWLPVPEDEDECESYYRASKTAMLLSDWTDEDAGCKNMRAVLGWPGRYLWNGGKHQLAAACQFRARANVCTKNAPADPGLRNLHEERYPSRTPAPCQATRNRACTCPSPL